MQQVLIRSIEAGGSSISDFISPDGHDGGYQDERRVYARKGLACHACGEEIKRRVMDEVTLHYLNKGREA